MKLIISNFYKAIVDGMRVHNMEMDAQEEWQGWDAWVNLDSPVKR